MAQFTSFAVVMLILFVKFYIERIRNRFIEVIYKAVMKLTPMQIKNTLKIVMFIKIDRDYVFRLPENLVKLYE